MTVIDMGHIKDIVVDYRGVSFIQQSGEAIKIELTAEERELLKERLEEYKG